MFEVGILEDSISSVMFIYNMVDHYLHLTLSITEGFDSVEIRLEHNQNFSAT